MRVHMCEAVKVERTSHFDVVNMENLEPSLALECKALCGVGREACFDVYTLHVWQFFVKGSTNGGVD